MWQIILKSVPVFSGLLLTFLISFVLHKRTSELAYSELLVRRNDEEKIDTLKYLLNWRDMLAALFIGLFVLQFSAVGQITSNNYLLALIASIITLAILPMMIISIWFLANHFEPHHVQSKRWYWLLLIVVIALCYVFSLVFTYM